MKVLIIMKIFVFILNLKLPFQDLGYHAHLVSLIACITIDTPISLITEFCQNGDLLHLVRRHKETIVNVGELFFIISIEFKIL
jgi:hypothetical protein